MDDPTIKATTCSHCGTVAAPGEGYCRACGQALLPPTMAAPPVAAIPTTMAAPPPVVPALRATPMAPPRRKRRSPLLMGCLIIIGVLVIAAGAGGIYVWRSASYTPPERKAPDLPQRAAGTLTEFPVDNDPNAPASPTSVQTEALGASASKTASTSPSKLPPGIDRAGLSKGATNMTSATYRPRPKTPSTTSSSATPEKEIYICVLTAMPNQPNFGEGLAGSVTRTTSGQRTGVRVQSPNGRVYVGSRIRSPQTTVYVLNKQGADVVILIYAPDPSMQDIADRLAQNVGNGEGLNDYPEVKNSLWTLPASTSSDLTLQEINTRTRDQIESSIAGSGANQGGDEVQRILSQMRPFIPERLTGARYTDASRQDWVALEFEYGSTFQAWKTWLLARSALGLGGAQSTTVREVNGLYLNQEGQRILVFQKGPYLVFLGGPTAAPLDRLVALGNQFQL
jgi:hypothetical protein